ncbi:hypothetical protein XAR_3431 [Xanthomonas citri pv. glycines str. 8ra]|nr:hypothetical protein XAR_3431 [Xanthomonas citri pv. glycines str. 8ra]
MAPAACRLPEGNARRGRKRGSSSCGGMTHRCAAVADPTAATRSQRMPERYGTCGAPRTRAWRSASESLTGHRSTLLVSRRGSVKMPRFPRDFAAPGPAFHGTPLPYLRRLLRLFPRQFPLERSRSRIGRQGADRADRGATHA